MLTMTTEHVDIWNNCLRIIREQLPPQSYDTWFRPIRPMSLKQDVLTLEVPSQFFFEYLENHYVELLKHSLRTTLGPQARLEYSIIVDDQHAAPLKQGASMHHSSSSGPIRKENSFGAQTVPNPFVIPGIKQFEPDSHLDPNFTFDSFIEGNCNRLARSAGFAVASKPGLTAYNPLFVYGGVGLGKTHLLHAIGNKTKKDAPNKAILYVSSEQFSQQFVDAVKRGSVSDFMNFYRMIDVLLVDDIQFFSGKTKTQEHFFHVFNHLRQSGKQIVLASDCAPQDMEGMEERLLSRFKWGLSASLQVPSFETRRSILQSKIYQNAIELPMEVVDYIAHNIDSNIRELEGAMVSLLAQSSLAGKDVDMDLARSLLENFIDKVSREVTIEAIQKIVAEHLHVDVELLKAKTRKRMIVQARQIAMYFAKQLTQHSLKAIGLHFGGRDHSTVIHALQTVNDLIATDKNFKQNVEEIGKRLAMESR